MALRGTGEKQRGEIITDSQEPKPLAQARACHHGPAMPSVMIVSPERKIPKGSRPIVLVR